MVNENTLNMGYIITSILSVLRFQASNSHKGPINSGQTVTLTKKNMKVRTEDA